MGDSDITTCVVMNKHDDQLMTLFTEWMDTGLKIAIFQNLDSSPLVGEMGLEDVDKFAKNLSKTRGEYLCGTREALSGRDEIVQFFLKDSKLRWKRGRWNQGLINVGSAPLAQMFPNILKKFVLRNRELESSVERLETEGRKLRTWQQELEEKLEEMVKLKNEMEKDLYSKFIIVLNSKKAKIRELQSETNDKAEPKDEEAFQAQTDDSEASEEEAAKTEQNNKSNDVSTSRSSNSATDNRPSTSRKRDIDSFALDLLDDGGSSTKKSANSSRLTFTGEESDEDLFL
ncbi:DNA repair protein XRCC4-like [Diprion similis]|uniref:DNA repair protein XRCC4-like n=1 Tax=Diprion similis TaxID=362088 RepID=UPI001EF9944B|nr:DNA repair protein XRCC4-like [Diprion similis]XP_046751063.1 DNA repair protein XRCC4-like [Diprion similis]